MKPLFIQAVLQDKIWGGTKLKDIYHFDILSQTTGEAWVISAHPNGDSPILSPQEFAGQSLSQVYQENPDLFGPNPPEKFPLLVKILDAKADLSVQVHPDDTYGLSHESELGKTECWYILDAQPGAQIIYGHQAHDAKEFKQLVDQGDWDQLLTKVPVKTGDFFYVPAGTIHAIGAGITILETQQNSDTTYRVYDYDRPDHEGKLRPLHLKDSLAVTRFPHYQDPVNQWQEDLDGGSIQQLLANDFFSVYKWQVTDQIKLDLKPIYYLATVIEGQGKLTLDGQTYPLILADSFILPYGKKEIQISGDLTLITSHPKSE